MVLNKSDTVYFGPYTVIFVEGEKSDYAYAVLSGEVEISSKINGSRVILTTVRPPHIFGELALLGERTRSATATTITGCELLRVKREWLESKMDNLDPFMRYWFLYLTDRLIDLTGRVGPDEKKEIT